MRIRGGARPFSLTAAALAGLLSLVVPAHAAPEIDQQTPAKKPADLKDILVPIPSWSPDVEANGCKAHSSPPTIADDFYALDGGPVVVRLGGDMTIDGGPGIRHAMLGFARRNDLLPC